MRKIVSRFSFVLGIVAVASSSPVLAILSTENGTIPEVLSYNSIKTITALQWPYANIDGPISTYYDSSATNRYWLMPYNFNGGVYLARTHTGASTGFNDLLGIAQERGGQWDVFSNWNLGGRWWLVSTYQLGTNPVELIAFVHIECATDTCSTPPGHGALGVAYYRDGFNNNKWRFAGKIVTALGDPAQWNIEGAPYLIKNNYIHVYYKDRDASGLSRVAVARTYLPGLITALRNGQNSPAWNKYRYDGWAEAGMGGSFTPLNIPGHHITHSGAVHSTYTHKYYLTTYVNSDQAAPFPGWPTGNGVFLFDSADGISWTFRTTLYWAGMTNVIPNSGGQHYPGFQYVSTTSTISGASSNGDVGSTFYVYSVGMFDDTSTTKMRVWRSTVTLETSDCLGTCGAP